LTHVANNLAIIEAVEVVAARLVEVVQEDIEETDVIEMIGTRARSSDITEKIRRHSQNQLHSFVNQWKRNHPNHLMVDGEISYKNNPPVPHLLSQMDFINHLFKP
jgi:hypothetical protein